MSNKKRFLEWIGVKENVHNTGRLPAIKDGDIWWAVVGENVGVEINGKNEVFSRPVLILKKLSRYGFMAVPLTSQLHEGDWCVPFVFQGKRQVAVLSQARAMSVSRLYRRMGAVPDSDLRSVADGFVELYRFKKYPL